MTLGQHGIVTLAELDAHGMRRGDRERALAAGALRRIRNGWFALPSASTDAVRAVRLGGRLTCGNALRVHGAWVLDDRKLHVSVRGTASRLRDPDRPGRPWRADSSPTVAVHWTSTIAARDGSPLESPVESVAHFIGCAVFESAVATLDSVLNSGLVSSATVATLLGGTSRGARLLAALNGESESGTESIARLRLRRLGLQVRAQARIAGVGRVDLLIGERLVLEIDSRTHHLGTNYERDRTRDLELVRQGYLVIRASYRMVMDEWREVEMVIRELVGRGDHRWRPGRQPEGLAIQL